MSGRADPRDSRPAYDPPEGDRLFAPSAARNAAPIAAALARRLGPAGAAVLEIGGGTGQHAVAAAAALSGRPWRPTDPDPDHLRSIAAWRAAEGTPNLTPPLLLDAREPADWTAAAAAVAGPIDAVFCANVIHIAPWSVAEGLVAGAASVLAPAGRLVLYGPFLEDGEAGIGNRAFDRSLRERNPNWGLRDTADLARLAARHGFGPPLREAMPANNLMLIFPALGSGGGAG
ncbi:MAG: DUF938 domain-containing protein [Paracoccaceae bacterium]